MNRQDFGKLIGKNSLTIAEAMKMIDSNQAGILFIVDDFEKLFGCITDGDIRRYLLAGGKISDNVLAAANKNPKVAKSMNEAKDLYHKRNYVMIPLINEKEKIVDFYSGELEEQIKKKNNPLNVPVVINAGGKGTRLDPLTRVLPKPLIPIGELPIIEHIMREYQSYNCNEFHIIVNYKKDLIKAYFLENDTHYNIIWHDEEKPLGTGGGLSLLRGKLNKTFFFANCDALLTADYEDILEFHKRNKNVITMICVHKSMDIPYGVVEVGSNSTVSNMKEKPSIPFLANTGIYIVEPEVINDIENNIPMGFPDIIDMERKKGKKVAVFPVGENDWMDMGQLPELEKMYIKMHIE